MLCNVHILIFDFVLSSLPPTKTTSNMRGKTYGDAAYLCDELLELSRVHQSVLAAAQIGQLVNLGLERVLCVELVSRLCAEVAAPKGQGAFRSTL